MLADDIIAACGKENDRALFGGISRFADAIKRAKRFDLTPGVMQSAFAVHRSPLEGRRRALPLCRLPFETTWFEWQGSNGEGYSLVGPDRFAPVPRRVGAIVTVDESRQRGIMSWAWYTKQQADPINVCPLSATFDWREEFEPAEDINIRAAEKRGISQADYYKQGAQYVREKYPRLSGATDDQITEANERTGVVWTPYLAEFTRRYEAHNGSLQPDHQLFQRALGDLTGEPGILQAVLMLLNSHNMTATEAVQAPEKLNKARARRGKPPLMDYTTIRIRLSHGLAQRAGSVGERSAARFHVVRGHFKVRKTGVYWWSDFARGDASKGTIKQQTRQVYT